MQSNPNQKNEEQDSKYVIVYAKTIHALIPLVNEWIEKGYRPIGGAFSADGQAAQTMLHNEIYMDYILE